jgi:hypothetical protein
MAAPNSEWLSLKLAAERIGEERLLPDAREGALRGVRIEAIVRDVMRIGAAKLDRAWLEGTLPLRGVKHGTDEEIDIPSSEAGRLALDCFSNCLVRLSSQGRRRLPEYHSVKARLVVVELLERDAKPPPKSPEAIQREREKKAARIEAARIWKDVAERVRGRAERSAEFERIWGEKKAEKARREKEEAERAAEQRAREEEEAARVEAEKRAREAEKEAEETEWAREALAETPKLPPKHPGGRPPGQPGVAMADAKKLDDFETRFPDEDEAQLLQRLKNDLQGTMTKPSVARRVRAAKAQWHANKEHQKT